MLVNRVAYGFGTSRLWHDPDYTIERPLVPLRVEKHIEQELPTQEHFEPKQYNDPYLALEKEYDVAFAQMARGQEGHKFLHGTKKAEAFDQAVAVQAVLNKSHTIASTPTDLEATQRVQAMRQQEALPVVGYAPSSHGTRTAGQAEQEKNAAQSRGNNDVTEALSMIGGTTSMAAAAATQVAATQTLSQAAQLASAVQTVAATGAAASGQVLMHKDARSAEETKTMFAQINPQTHSSALEDNENELPSVEPVIPTDPEYS